MLTSVKFSYPEEYKLYLTHFHGSRDYFECHEILEEYWLEQNKEVRWLALIQLAVAVYHERQENYRGSRKLYEKVLLHMKKYPYLFEELSIDHTALQNLIHARIDGIELGSEYQPFNLPVIDEDLVQECRMISQKWQVSWESDDTNAADELKYKHRLRDRSEVIVARKASLTKKVLERQF